ncbi:hypothetical protein FS749_015007 [Ceratobasidium sp. UAMH 11750]|nr:hypothetical protein FS749_015007 [Ceratobasidium sp. UAMH 11750]
MKSGSLLRFRGHANGQIHNPRLHVVSATAEEKLEPDHQAASGGGDANMEYINLGVWDYYEQRWTSFDHLPGVRYYFRVTRGFQGASSARRLIKDTYELAPYLFILYVVCFVFESILPAFVLKYNMRMLDVITAAVESQAVDSVLGPFTPPSKSSYASKLTFPSIYFTVTYARLDLPTFNNEGVRSQLENVMVEGSPPAWSYLTSIFNVWRALLELASQSSVLFGVFSQDKEFVWMALVSFIEPLMSWWNRPLSLDYVWKASVNNEHYMKMEGFRKSVQDPSHRTDIVAGGLGDYIRSEYQKSRALAGIRAQSFWDARRFLMARRGMNLGALCIPLLKDIPQVFMALRAIDRPATVPLSLVQLDLVQQTVTLFVGRSLDVSHLVEVLTNNFRLIKNLYDLVDIPNEVHDVGKDAQPHTAADKKASSGFGVEFQNVCFKYPRTDAYVIRNMSFQIKPGQLCVFVGENGSAKSTTLKLIARLYDAENRITINGEDIRSMPLEKLRRHIMLFSQDFSVFPLPIRDNIAMGCPTYAHDESRILQAIHLGGATDFVQSLPQGLDSYLTRPVHDWCSGMGQEAVFSQSTAVSGGQQQRLALSRAFMRANDPDVKLWLFDEPSASLDPAAESVLFERLRNMRGSQTIIFSSHRFGGLTPFADLILYFKDSQVVEAGTHDELMGQDGHYARLYNIQARSFQE